MQALIIVLVIAVVAGFIALGAYTAAQRRKALTGWAQTKGLTYRRDKDRSMDERYPGFKCLREGSSRYAYNIMDGDWSGRRITAFDYHYATHSRDSKGRRRTHHHHFSALVLNTDLRLKPLFIRPESFFDKLTEFVGFDDIDFESAEFSRKFYVKAEDRRWAYDVIHARTMEFLLDRPQFSVQFNGHNVIAYRSSRFGPEDFETAAEVVCGMLERLPDYLVKRLREEQV